MNKTIEKWIPFFMIGLVGIVLFTLIFTVHFMILNDNNIENEFNNKCVVDRGLSNLEKIKCMELCNNMEHPTSRRDCFQKLTILTK